MGLLPCKSCGSVVIGGGDILQGGGLITCGDSLLLYEGDGVCATITGQGQVNPLPGGATPCTSVLEFETCDGQVIRKILPNPSAGSFGVTTPVFNVACVKRMLIRCEPTPGGAGCSASFRFSVSHCVVNCDSN